MEEIWKDITGYEGQYKVSNLGRVKSLDRFVRCKGGGKQFRKGRILAQRKRTAGEHYISVNLCKDNAWRAFDVHRLVAQEFIPNPFNKPQVNHIDENPENNRADNLEWVTPYENMHHNDLIGRINRVGSKPVQAFDKQGRLVYSLEKIGDVTKYGFSRSAVSQNISGRTKTSGGLIWKLAE